LIVVEVAMNRPHSFAHLRESREVEGLGAFLRVLTADEARYAELIFSTRGVMDISDGVKMACADIGTMPRHLADSLLSFVDGMTPETPETSGVFPLPGFEVAVSVVWDPGAFSLRVKLAGEEVA
jgi:hypothetical protein